ncbi:MAG TPA: cytochrome c-type biogenesis protein CcmH [Solirubrobacteraceae bacterium]|nr:cytochrome c-type biogenesis protein CcmH [Solirubrobacteraceae bacterium]
MRRPALAPLCPALAPLCLALALLWLAPAFTGDASASQPPRASLTGIERQVMCVTCKIPLNVAESPQADRERAFIRELIDGGLDEAQIKHALVGQYGSTVLALPPASGFDLTVYLVPAAVVAALAALLATLLVRWRRRGEGPAEAAEEAPPLSASDASRLEADLSRFD